MLVPAELLTAFANIEDGNTVIVSSCGYEVGIGFHPAYFLVMKFLKLKRALHGPGVKSPEPLIFGAGIDVVAIPLDARYSLIVGCKLIRPPFFEIVKIDKCSMRVSKCYFSAGR